VIYWAWSNTLSIGQQYFIMKRHGAPVGKQAAAAVPATTPPGDKKPNKTKPKKD